MRVRLVCGEEEVLYGGSEPSTCVYDTYFTTPTACTENELSSITAQLRQLEALQAEVQAEIEAAAAFKDEL